MNFFTVNEKKLKICIDKNMLFKNFFKEFNSFIHLHFTLQKGKWYMFINNYLIDSLTTEIINKNKRKLDYSLKIFSNQKFRMF